MLKLLKGIVAAPRESTVSVSARCEARDTFHSAKHHVLESNSRGFDLTAFGVLRMQYLRKTRDVAPPSGNERDGCCNVLDGVDDLIDSLCSDQVYLCLLDYSTVAWHHVSHKGHEAPYSNIT